MPNFLENYSFILNMEPPTPPGTFKYIFVSRINWVDQLLYHKPPAFAQWMQCLLRVLWAIYLKPNETLDAKVWHDWLIHLEPMPETIFALYQDCKDVYLSSLRVSLFQFHLFIYSISPSLLKIAHSLGFVHGSRGDRPKSTSSTDDPSRPTAKMVPKTKIGPGDQEDSLDFIRALLHSSDIKYLHGSRN